METAISVGDHLSSIADVSQAKSPRVISHWTLARSALEGAARVSFLLNASEDLRTRVLRAAVVALVSAEAELTAADGLHVVPGLQLLAQLQAQGRLEAAKALLDQAGVIASHDKRGRVRQVCWSGSSSGQAPPNITALCRVLLPSHPAAYQVGSGAAHGQSWVISSDDTFDLATGRVNVPFDAASLAGAVDLAIASSVAVLDSFAAMLGQDSADEHGRARIREQAVSQLVRPLLASPA